MKFYFFDLDGTLEDSRDDMVYSVNIVRELLGLHPRNNDELKKHVNRGMYELYMACFDDYFKQSINFDLSYQKIKTEYEKNYLENICLKSFCYEGVKDVLEELSKNSKIIIVTNKPEKHSRALLKELNISEYIIDVMGGDSCEEMKPSALPLKIAAKRHGFVSDRDSSYMVGDSAGDVEAGKAFGAKTVWCSFGYNKTFGTTKPDYVIKSPLELLTLL
ncbi:HAD family hydrolase [Fluviispira multicolorata]|uniref:HAD-IA family hydrolase n=1 Tax=Fluviispira multicolorata TaxID=2654512 RepID=A0A833JD77_9BACT|nr:HAD-IA family hydrolase [Fluviispira multicolorata]KAB8030987.1 HAD-IA family hydrolase [Fluviispira multicolorata]